ncbi:MAG: hypothetical protein JW807_14075 [Spirochaetes bacterium]|nr:hypothetical protein [Spirochaetota bacterium]
MLKKHALCAIPLISLLTAFSLFCSKESRKADVPAGGGDLSLNEIDIDKKYLSEGFLSDNLYRVVIVTLKESGSPDIDLIRAKARKRALVSLERSLAADDVSFDRNTRAGILDLVRNNAKLERQDIEHKRYEVYYFDIKKSHMKNYLKNISSER